MLLCRRLQPSNRLHYHQRRQHQQRIRGITLITRTGLDGFIGLSSLLKPEVAAMFSAALAAGSVGLNYYGNLLTESKRVELQKEVRLLLLLAYDVTAPGCLAARLSCRQAVLPPGCTVTRSSLSQAVLSQGHAGVIL